MVPRLDYFSVRPPVHEKINMILNRFKFWSVITLVVLNSLSLQL